MWLSRWEHEVAARRCGSWEWSGRERGTRTRATGRRPQGAKGRLAPGGWRSEPRAGVGILAADASARVGGAQNDGAVGSPQDTIWGH